MLVFHDNMEKIKENQKAFHLCIVVLFIHVIAQEDEDLSSSSLALPQSVYETNKKEKKNILWGVFTGLAFSIPHCRNYVEKQMTVEEDN